MPSNFIDLIGGYYDFRLMDEDRPGLNDPRYWAWENYADIHWKDTAGQRDRRTWSDTVYQEMDPYSNKEVEVSMATCENYNPLVLQSNSTPTEDVSLLHLGLENTNKTWESGEQVPLRVMFDYPDDIKLPC